MTNPAKLRRMFLWMMLVGEVVSVVPDLAGQTRVIEITADSDSRYKMAGGRSPEITAKAGEQLLLRITAHRGKSWNRDGSIHGFTLLRAKDRTKVDGWDLLLKPGTQEYTMTVPDEPGAYEVVCTVICSEDHEGMHMKFTVLP
jgi:heme/copper-type cytochrome/quinol oxidase subunit 2